jgi:GT2 family glycosyltransferase/glycosyltransferase involved in cell wall biosynthesis
MTAPVDVIVPVFNGIEDLRRCLRSLLGARVSVVSDIIVIDDASPDPEVARYLETLRLRHPEVQVLSNARNLGFVGTVNRGMALHPERDVVLLNSDTIVANDWLGRLRRCAYSHNQVGSVTPFSNNATICSFPRSCEVNALPPGWDVSDLDRVFAEVNAGSAVEIPTGIGFCMYLKRACLSQVGCFDEATFGRGYGEENDFCMRAARLGWRDLLCCDTFVYHAGGSSFGSEKRAREQAAVAALVRLYPDYEQRILRHIQDDPARPARIRVLLETVRRSAGRRVLYVTHALGGGIERHLDDLAGALGEKLVPLVLRPDEVGLRVGLGAGAADPALEFRLPEHAEALVAALRYLGIERLHFHHTMGLDPWVWGLPQRLEVPFDLSLHDYYLINANPTLIDRAARYCAERSGRDVTCAGAYPIPGGVSAEVWRRNQEPLLYGAARVFAPSACTLALYREYFPGIEATVAPHPDWEADHPYPVPRATAPASALRVVVLGALSREKGADTLEQVAVACRERGVPIAFSLIGYAYRPLDGVVSQWGAYRDADLESLMHQANPHLVWFPASWPETYSYTLSAVLRNGLPVVAPDIGAFPERLGGRPLTWILPWNLEVNAFCEFFAGLAAQLEEAEVPGSWPQEGPEVRAFRYVDGYLTSIAGSAPPGLDLELNAALAQRGVHSALGGQSLTGKERFLATLIRLRELPMLSGVARIVPFSVQRQVKRWLSRRPIHDIVSSR